MMASNVISGGAVLPRSATLLTQLSHTDEFSGAPYCSSRAVKVDTVLLVTVRLSLKEVCYLQITESVLQWLTDEYKLLS